MPMERPRVRQYTTIWFVWIDIDNAKRPMRGLLPHCAGFVASIIHKDLVDTRHLFVHELRPRLGRRRSLLLEQFVQWRLS